MKQKMLLMMVAMLMVMAGTMTTACSSDDDVVTPKEQNAEQADTKGGKAQLPDVGDFIKTVTDTGHMYYNANEDCWYVDALLPVPEGETLIDGGICYFMYNLPDEFKKDGQKVKFTGDVYECKDIDKNGDDITTMLGGWVYYDVVIKEIEFAE